MASIAILKLQIPRTPVTLQEEEQAISFRLPGCCGPLRLGQKMDATKLTKAFAVCWSRVTNTSSIIWEVFLIDYDKGLSPLFRHCTLLVVVWLLARSGVDCQVSNGYEHVNSSPLITASYSAVLLEHPLVMEKEYGISALSGETNTIWFRPRYPVYFLFFLLLDSWKHH